MNAIRWAPPERPVEVKGTFWGELKEERRGICLHYDGSSSDAGGVAWLSGLDVKASYHLVVYDDGSWSRIAPLDARAWHVGKSKPGGAVEYTDGNSALYGIAILNSGREDVTTAQLLTVGWLCRRLFERERWARTEGWRITTHSVEAWPRGRKTDPEGADPRNPILAADDVRPLVQLFDAVAPL